MCGAGSWRRALLQSAAVSLESGRIKAGHKGGRDHAGNSERQLKVSWHHGIQEKTQWKLSDSGIAVSTLSISLKCGCNRCCVDVLGHLRIISRGVRLLERKFYQFYQMCNIIWCIETLGKKITSLQVNVNHTNFYYNFLCRNTLEMVCIM